MAHRPFLISPVPQASWTNVLADGRADEVVLPAELVGRRYKTLCRLSRSLVSGTPEDWIRHLRADLEAIFHLDRLDVVVYGTDGDEVQWRSPATKQVTGEEVAIEEALLLCYQRQQAPWIEDGSTEEGRAVVGQALKNLDAEYGSYYGLPLSTPHRCLGALGLASYQPNPLTTEDLEFLNQVADRFALAIDHWLVHLDLQREKAHVKLLLDLTSQVLSNVGLRDVVRATIMNTRSAIRSDGACVFLQDTGSGELQVYAFDFPQGTETFQEGTPIAFEGTIAGRVFQTGKLWAGSLEEARVLFTNPYPVMLTAEFKTGCMLPIPGRHRIMGALGLGRHADSPYSRDELDFLTQVSKQIAIAVESALAYEEIRQLKERLAQEKVHLQEEIHSEINFEEIIGNSPRLKAVLESVRTVAPANSTVLIEGETGTGKELIARAIHNLSPRKGQAFVKVNCAAIPSGLLESDLFGHEKGSFTGAIAQKIGRFELAHKGTLFLDEVGDIPLELQPKLLRVLQEQEFERLGSTRTQRVDVRLLAATHASLSQMVAEKKFRSDLYYRLNVFPVVAPPLRERGEDIPLLIRHFANKYARRMGKKIESIPKETMDALSRYAWPGNIRELQNLMERAVLLSTGSSLRVPLGEIVAGSDHSAVSRGNALEQAEREQIVRALRESDWVVGGARGAAARLGLKRTSLDYRMQKLGISRPPR
jgi:formate hydrogenlyase transcriptional activator